VNPAEIKIARAKAGLILSAPFYATLALRMEFVRMDSIQTMATDGKRIFWSESFVNECTDAELKGTVAHEVMHVANLHHTRRNGRDPEQWNIACDLAINPGLIADGFELPKGILIDPQYAGKSAEQIFAIRAGKDQQQQPGQGPQQPGQPGQGPQPGQGQGQPQPGQGQGQGQPQPGQGFKQPGGILDAAPDHDKAALAEAEAEANAATLQAVNAGRQAGKESAEGKRIAAQIKKPVTDWRETLRRYIDSSVRVDYQWSRPNRRFLSSGVYLPGKVKDGLDGLAIIIDVSSSIDRKAFDRFMSEATGAIETVNPDRVDVIQCNTRIVAHDSFVQGESIDVKLKVGGGTDLQPAFDLCSDATVILCFTDCEFDKPIRDEGIPVLWVKYGDNVRDNRLPKFGEIIEIGE
jgi:predicted metal-dependent peptidase